MDWRFKVARLTILGRLPFGAALRVLKRRYFGYEPDPDNLRGTLADFEQMQESLRCMGRSFEGATVLEIGSGWFPTIPIMLAVGGAREVLMTDLNRHMDDVTFASTLRFLKSYFPDNEHLRAITCFQDLPISYLTPFDARTVAPASVNFVLSRTVLEHIWPDDIAQLLKSLAPALAPGALMLHLVDHSDHLEHADKSISKINFLTWSKRKHALINYLTKEGENRLRHHEYPLLFGEAGYKVIRTTATIHEPTRSAAKSLPLVSPYSGMSPEEVATLASLYVLSPHSAAM